MAPRKRPANCYLPRFKASGPVHLIPVENPSVILTPCGLLCVAKQIRSRDVMTDADFGSSQAGEVLLSHVSARAIEAVCLLMVDSFDLETLM